jgi:putative phosphoserine phosphatase/1-acylglycerol-3-phosphate O-acyltransferase
VWPPGKHAAITDWADRNGVDLAESYAYSDSVYDTPMLAAVGHPIVVNPDPRMVLWLPLGGGRRSVSTCHPVCSRCP